MDYSRDIVVVRFQACVHSLFGILFPEMKKVASCGRAEQRYIQCHVRVKIASPIYGSWMLASPCRNASADGAAMSERSRLFHSLMVYTRGRGTQLWVGYGCAARSFDHHPCDPVTKPEKMQICNLCLNHLFLEGPFLKPSSTFYHVNWDT